MFSSAAFGEGSAATSETSQSDKSCCVSTASTASSSACSCGYSCSSASNGSRRPLLSHAKAHSPTLNNLESFQSDRCRSPSFERVMLGLTKSFGFDVLKSSQARRKQRLNAHVHGRQKQQQHQQLQKHCSPSALATSGASVRMPMANYISPSASTFVGVRRMPLPNFSSPSSSDEGRRRELFEGLRDSEEAFCLRLTELNESYLKVLHQRKVLDSRKCSHLFQFISRVAQLHGRLLKRLNSADSIDDYPAVLLASADEFKCYSPFLLSFHKLIFTINELLRQNAKFSDLVGEVTSECAGNGNPDHTSCAFTTPTRLSTPDSSASASVALASSRSQSHDDHDDSSCSSKEEKDRVPRRHMSVEEYLSGCELYDLDRCPAGGHSHVCDHDIRSLFAAPITRLAAYENFLVAAQAETEVDTGGHKNIADALARFTATRKWIYQSLAVNRQTTAQVRVIQTLLHTRPDPSDEGNIRHVPRPLRLTDVPNRRLLRYGFAQYVCSECTSSTDFFDGRLEFCSLFLFSDSLVWCDVRNQLLGMCAFKMCSFRGTRDALGDVRGFEISSTDNRALATESGARFSERSSKKRSQKTSPPIESFSVSNAGAKRVDSSPAPPPKHVARSWHAKPTTRAGLEDSNGAISKSKSSSHLSSHPSLISPATYARDITKMSRSAMQTSFTRYFEPRRPSSTPPLHSSLQQTDSSSPRLSTVSSRCSPRPRKYGSQKLRIPARRPKLELAFSQRAEAAKETTQSAEIVFTSSREATEWVRLIKDAIQKDRNSRW